MSINKGVVKKRETIQKIKIFEYLRNVKIHPTAETIYKHVKKEISTITLATVYRNLNLMAENFEILRFEVNKKYHYDANLQKHQHCICRKCGKITDVFKKKISDYALKNLDNTEFNAEEVQVLYYGTCKKCGGKTK